MRTALPGILGEAERDQDVRVVAVTGVDPACSAGMDTLDGDPVQTGPPKSGRGAAGRPYPVVAAVDAATAVAWRARFARSVALAAGHDAHETRLRPEAMADLGLANRGDLRQEASCCATNSGSSWDHRWT